MQDALYVHLILGLLMVGEVMWAHNVKGQHHIEMPAASSSSMSMASFCRPQSSLKLN